MTPHDPMTTLAEHGIKPSVQRLAVMGYLLAHRTHPTVDEIYNALTAEIPTLSKTTVYNTLRLLVEHGAASQLTIDERNVCFDAETAPHAHFLCTHCGHVYDVPLRAADLSTEAEIPEGFSTASAALYYRGTCKVCNH